MSDTRGVRGGSTLVMLSNMAKNVLSQLASAQGKELSPNDISNDDPNLKAAIITIQLFARAFEKAKQDPTHTNLLEMNRFDESCNLLAASKATYDLYKKLQEQALPHKSQAIANHEQYERALKETETLADQLASTLAMLATNIVNKVGITPEAAEQLKTAKQEQKKFVEIITAVIKGAEFSNKALKADSQVASKAAAERSMTQTPSPESPG